MRIAMIAACPFPWPRGTPVRVHRMAEALTQKGHQVQVVTYHLGDLTQPLPFAVHRIRNVRGYTDCRPGPHLRKLLQLDPLLIGTLGKLLREQTFDVIHAHHYEGLLAALLSNGGRAKPPIIYDAHTLLASELPYYRMGLSRNIKSWIGSVLDRNLPARADHVIAVTENIRDVLTSQGRVPPEKITVVHNGVESEYFSHSGQLAQQSGSRRLMFAGNLAPYQGIDLLLQAFALVRQRLTDVKLVLLTDSDFAPYAPLAATLGVSAAVELLRPDFAHLPAHLHSADVLLNPRPACDGIPQKLLNYMAAGRPIVSFAGSAKIIKHQRTGLVVNDGDVQAFAAAALQLLAQPELGRQLGDNARQLVTASYAWHQVAEQVEAVYARVLAGRERDVA